MKKFFRKIGATLGTITLAVTGVIAIPSLAFADNYAVGGNVTGNEDGTVINERWTIVETSGGTTAWTKFVNRHANSLGWRKTSLEANVRKSYTGGNTTDIVTACKKSNYIWYKTADGYYGGDRWVNQFWVRFATTKGLPGNIGSSAANNYFNNNIKSHLSTNGKYTIICSYGWASPKYSTSFETTIKGSSTVSGLYSVSTSISPQYLARYGTKTSESGWSVQTPTVKKTTFGTYYDSIITNNPLSSAKNNTQREAKYKEIVNNATTKINADKNTNYVSTNISLNENNQKILADGGVVNVEEYAKTASISTSFSNKYKLTYVDCTRKVSGVQQKTSDAELKAYFKAVVKNYGCNASKSKITEVNTSSVSKTHKLNSQYTTGFWQMISVHCNKEQFDSLKAALGGNLTVTSVDSSNTLSATGYTIAKSSKKAAQTSGTLLGVSSVSNSAVAVTGTLGFYDKECPFDCTSSSNVGDGASKANDATNNVGTDGYNKETGTKQGAQASDSTSGNFFNVFRDNVVENYRIDTWYPISNSLVEYKKTAPLTTTFTLWNKSTPYTTSNSGGTLTVTNAATGASIFKAGNTNKVPTQKNWNTTIFANENTAIVSGLVNKIGLQGTWASEDNRPVILNAKWEYAPNVAQNIPSSFGFTSADKASVGTNKVVSTPIQGKCYAQYGQSTADSTVALFQQYTGTGTTNTLDTSPVSSPSSSDSSISIDNASVDAYNLVFQFVRATTE